MELLEYILQVRGAAVAGAEVRGLAGEMNKLAVSQERVGASGDKAAAGSAKMASAMGLVGKVAKVGALGLAAIGLEAVKMSTQFNHEMLRVQTETGGTAKELANMKNAVLDLAASGKSMGQGPQSLALGLYHLESLGLRGKKAIHALTLASQEAAISGASLEQTTSALGAAMFVGVKGAGSLDNIMALLNATVGSGNMRFAQLIESLGTGVLGAFKAAHLSIQDMSASVAVLTDGGYPASSAMAQLSTALHFLYSPSMKASNAMDSVGLSGRKLYGDLQKPRGLLVALKDLHAHLKNLSGFQQSQVLTSILPGGRGRVLLNLYEQIGRLQGKYGQEKSIMGEFKTGVRIQVHDPQTQLKTAEAGVQASLIRLGNVLTPIVLPALTAILHVGKDVLDWLTALPAHIKAVVGWFQELPGPVRTIITLVGLMAGQAILLTTLAKAFGAVKTAIELLGGAFGKLTLKKLGIMALVAVAILIVTHWKEVKKVD